MSKPKQINPTWLEGYTPDDPDNARNPMTHIYDHELYIEFDELDESIVILADEFLYSLLSKVIRGKQTTTIFI